MRKRAALKIAVSPLVLGATLVGCTTTQGSMFRPVAASAQEARADEQAIRYHDLALQTLQKGDKGAALNYAEKAVELSPRDAGYRLLLGDLYLKNGRFLSAETAFSDVLTLHPANDKARFNLALAEIALGKQYAALVQLDRLAETVAPADIGLAYALAGQPARAVALLEPAARAANADGRVRQNLALAYALSGDWQRAKVTAGQDLSPADLQPRMEEWASFTQPQTSYDQVATLLGVTAIEDSGQPTRLALAPAPEAPALARNEPAPGSISAPIVDVPAPVETAQALPEAAPQALPEAASQPAVQYAEAAPAPVAPKPAIVRTDAVPAYAPAPAKQPMVRRSAASGRYVVQLGSYNSARGAELAWSSLQKRFGLSAFAPVRATVSLPKGTFHRLSAAGFSTQAEAARTCQSIKAKGGACFVRTISGDAPIRMASR